MIQFSSTSNKLRHIKQNNCKPRSISTVNNNIYINNYKNERTDYITIKAIATIFNEEIEDNAENDAITRYIEFKYFNIDFPENWNIKFLKNCNCIVKSNNEWTLQHIDELAEKLYNLNYNEVCEKIKSYKSYFNEDEYEDLQKKISLLNIKYNIKCIKKKIKLYKMYDEKKNLLEK
jgi:hypothetical protein